MKAILQVDPSAATPLWRQIEEGVTSPCGTA